MPGEHKNLPGVETGSPSPKYIYFNLGNRFPLASVFEKWEINSFSFAIVWLFIKFPYFTFCIDCHHHYHHLCWCSSSAVVLKNENPLKGLPYHPYSHSNRFAEVGKCIFVAKYLTSINRFSLDPNRYNFQFRAIHSFSNSVQAIHVYRTYTLWNRLYNYCPEEIFFSPPLVCVVWRRVKAKNRNLNSNGTGDF